MRSPESHLHDVLSGNERSVLDVGTGHSGVMDFWRWEAGGLVLKGCVDVHSMRRDIPKAWFKVIADGAQLPFRDGVFDVVQCTETLEHVPPARWVRFLDELFRVSKDLVYVTTTDETEHLGEGQRRFEELNPFQKFQAFPSEELFVSKGFHRLFVSPHHIIAFKRKHPLWDSTFKDMEDYVIELTRGMPAESVVDVGTGMKGVVAQHYWQGKIKRGYAVDVWKIKTLSPLWSPLKMNALDLLDKLGSKSVDVVQAFGFLEHLKKRDGYRFLRMAEELAKKLVIVSAATYIHGPTRDYKVKMEGNPYHYYWSTWHWKEFEDLGYKSNFEDMKRGITFSGEAIAWKRP